MCYVRAAILLGMASSLVLGASAIAEAEPVKESSLAAGAANEEEAARVLFRGDERLERKVTVAQKDQPMGELLAALGRKLNVPLTASPDTADDKVSLFLVQRPAAEILTLLARQFRFRWYREKDRYRLGQSVAGRQQEAFLRERDLRERLAAIHAQAEQTARVAAFSREALIARQAQLEERFKDPELAPDELDRLSREGGEIFGVLYGGSAAGVAIYRSLTARQVRRLLEGREVRLSSAEGTLSPAFVALVRQAVIGTAELFSAIFPDARARRVPLPDETEVAVRLSDNLGDLVGPPALGEPYLRLEILWPTGPETDRRRWERRMGWSADDRQLPPKRPATRTNTDDPVLTRVVRLTLPKPDPPPGDRDRSAWLQEYEFFGAGAWPAGMPTLGDLGEALHRATGLEIVADSFVRARMDTAAVTAPRPLVEILDQVANELDTSWRKEGNLILFRSRRFYRDRAEAVPERLLRPWRERVRRAGHATLDDLAGLAAAVNDAQARGLHQYWGWYFENLPALPPNRGAGGFCGSRPHLRLWASLTPQQRQAALRGEVLPVAGLSLPQRAAFQAALLSSVAREFEPGELSHEPALEELMAGAFHLQAGSPHPDESPFPIINYTFAYHLAGEETPAREVEMQVIMPPSRPLRGRTAVEGGSASSGTPAHGARRIPVGRNDG